MIDIRGPLARVLALGAIFFSLGPSAAGAAPEGTLTFALHFSPVNR